MLSATLRESKSAEYWKTIAISPSEVIISPLSGVRSPQISFKIVLFPEPLNPTIASVSLSLTLNDISSITRFSPNVFTKFLTSILIQLSFLVKFRVCA